MLALQLLIVTLVALAAGVMHDANHGSFSKYRSINRVARGAIASWCTRPGVLSVTLENCAFVTVEK